MGKPIIRKIRRRVFIGCEGKGEIGLVRWLGRLCDGAGCAWAFDPQDLQGGDPRAMLADAMRRRDRGQLNGAYTHAILLLDADRIGDPEDTRRLAAKARLTLILQRPKLEGVLLRLHAGQERHFPPPEDTNHQLLRVWPEVWGGNHRRAVDADTLGRRFTLDDLRRAAAWDEELRCLLDLLGLPP